MDWLVWSIIIIFIIAILILLIAGLFVPQQSTTQSTQISTAEQESLLTLTRPEPQWGPDQPSTTPVRNTCQLYTFPARMDGPYAILGRPSFNSSSVNNLPPGGPPSGCSDIDQLALQQFTRTCIQDQCQGSDGQTYNQGEVQTYYGLCGSGNSSCNDVLGVISVGFVPLPKPTISVISGDDIDTTATPVQCLEVNSTFNMVTQNCNLASVNQLLRVYRYDTGGTTIDNSTGPYAIIIHRATGLALAPQGVSATGTNVSPNTPLTLVNASTLPNNGIIWWLFPGGLRFELVSGSDVQFTIDEDGNTNPIIPDGDSLQTVTIPPQLLYWTEIGQTPPASNLQLDRFLRQNRNRLFSAANQGNGVQVLLQPMALDDSEPNKIYNSQLLSYAIFNLIATSSTLSKHW